MTTQRAARALVAAGIGGYFCLQWLGRTYGSTRAERRQPMPGDDLVRCPQTMATHAVTIPVAPDRVWQWLVQVGWHRGGWYTARWVDALLFPANAPSADRVLEEHQDLEVGDFIPDGPPETECGFVVRDIEPGVHLVLFSTSHLPLQLRARGLAGVSWTWSFGLMPVETRSGPGTRLVFRWRARTSPWWMTAVAQLLLIPADFVMSRDMLRGLRRRATGHKAFARPSPCERSMTRRRPALLLVRSAPGGRLPGRVFRPRNSRCGTRGRTSCRGMPRGT